MNHKNRLENHRAEEQRLPSKEELLSILKDAYVRNRIYNIRHGETLTKGDVEDHE
jgi:hypothetical protein